MKNICLTTSIIIWLALFFGCSSGPQMLDDDQLERIITQAMVTNALLDKTSSHNDTLDPYLAILENEDATYEDVKYTVEQMAGRKSNPLDNMFTTIKTKVDSVAGQVMYRYKQKIQYDTMALNFSKDTVYRIDTVIKGSPHRFKKVLRSIKKGTYDIVFDYKSNSNYDISVPMVMVTKVSKKEKINDNAWMNRAYSEQTYRHVVNVNNTLFDSIEIGFSETTIAKGRRPVKDTSYIKNIRIIYTADINTARNIYFEHNTGINLYNKLKYAHTLDSLLPRSFRRDDRQKRAPKL